MRTFLLLLLLIPGLALPQNPPVDSLDAFIAKQVKDYNVPGLAIGIIKNNQVHFKKGYGATNVTHPVAVTTETVFPILSCTKAFTAAAMAMLVDEGKLRWNDKVIKYLPDFKLSDPGITKELTIADVLSHRSGLESFEGDLLWYGTEYSKEEIVRRIRYSKIRNRFREDYGYQNIMYLVAGLIIEKVSGKSWNDFLKERIFSPLMMNHTSSRIQEMMKDSNYARPHLSNLPIPLINMDNIGPAGSVNSTIDDMINWLQTWIDRGVFKGYPLLSPASFNTITSEKIKLSRTSNEAYGFGWNLGSENGKKVLSHGGGMPGYKSFITIIPEDKTAIIILTNKITYLNEELVGVILKYLDVPNLNWKDADAGLMGKNFHFSWDEVDTDTSHTPQTAFPNVSLYTGMYEDEGYGKATISEENGKMVLELLPSRKQFSGYMSYKTKERFGIIFTDKFVPPGEVIFTFDKNQRPSSFKLNIESGDFHFKYLNFKRVKL